MRIAFNKIVIKCDESQKGQSDWRLMSFNKERINSVKYQKKLGDCYINIIKIIYFRKYLF
ncbi:unnamed protein product [Paramecium octaurelia]|uniref:Uncharacterized protein n=1 Tax=Paramecium octaurelia TaxID=43137 RepID=A0A8S1S8L6_PAROT|nr:unnamed protein product [Paramecium octaurelia]